MIRRVFAVVLATAFAAAVPACAQTIFVQDSFTVAANTMLEAHTPNTGGAWTRQTGGSGITINAAADNARNVAAADWSIYSNGTIAPTARDTCSTQRLVSSYVYLPRMTGIQIWMPRRPVTFG